MNVPITSFRSRSEPFFRLLKRRVNGRFTPINRNTILVRKGALLIGSVNERNVISPLYDASNNWVLFNLNRNQIIDITYLELQSLGVFGNFEGVRPDRSLSPGRILH